VTAAIPANAETTADRQCAACGHSWNTHDDIAARFCAATIVNKFSRGCVCVPGASDVPGSAK